MTSCSPPQPSPQEVPGGDGHHLAALADDLVVVVVTVPDMDPVEGQEGDLAEQLGLILLLEEEGAHPVALCDVVEQPVAGRHLHSRVHALLTLELLNHEVVVAPGDGLLLAAPVVEDL